MSISWRDLKYDWTAQDALISSWLNDVAIDIKYLKGEGDAVSLGAGWNSRITATQLADDAVTNSKIAANAVKYSELAPNAATKIVADYVSALATTTTQGVYSPLTNYLNLTTVGGSVLIIASCNFSEATAGHRVGFRISRNSVPITPTWYNSSGRATSDGRGGVHMMAWAETPGAGTHQYLPEWLNVDGDTAGVRDRFAMALELRR